MLKEAENGLLRIWPVNRGSRARTRLGPCARHPRRVDYGLGLEPLLMLGTRSNLSHIAITTNRDARVCARGARMRDPAGPKSQKPSF